MRLPRGRDRPSNCSGFPFHAGAQESGWRKSLEALVDIELDFSGTRNLPGFLSEAYSGNGTEYTGLIGIPDLAVTDKPSSPTRLPLHPWGRLHDRP